MKTIIKQSADGIVLIGDNKLDTTQAKVFINNHEITDIDTFFKVAEENTRLFEQVKKQKEVIDKVAEYIEKHIKYECDDAYNGIQFYSYHLYDFNKQELLDILKEVSE